MEVMRPYMKTILLSDTNRHTVDLKDSNGNLLDCNFVSLESSAATTPTQVNNYIKLDLHISSLYTSVYNTSSASDYATPIGSQLNTSGFCGIMHKGTRNIPSNVDKISLSDGDRVNQVTLQAANTGEILAILTYGQIQHSNNLRASNRGIGN